MSRTVIAEQTGPGTFAASIDPDTEVIVLPPVWLEGSAKLTVGSVGDGFPERPVGILGLRTVAAPTTFVVQTVVHAPGAVTVELHGQVTPERGSVGGDDRIRTDA